MTLIEATLAANDFYTSPANRAYVISALMSGKSDLCDDCGFIKDAGTICEICEGAWADEQAAKEEELNWGRLEMAGGRW